MAHSLFIDETGNPNPLNTQSGIYVVCGVCVPEESREKLKIKADQIKFKYWGKTNIVFHSLHIGTNSKEFAIFRNDTLLKTEFLKDLFNFLNQSGIIVFVVAVDKVAAKTKRWEHIKIVKETSRFLFYHFITWLLSSKSVGKIFIESSEKNLYYLHDFTYFLSPGIKELSTNYEIIQKRLTSLSFFTKKNFDIEGQLADILSYGARCKFERDRQGKIFISDSYEDKLIKTLESKLFIPPPNAKSTKKHFYQNIEPFCILPK